MPKSSTKRLKEPFNPALDAPVALTPDQIEQVAGGFGSAISVGSVDLRKDVLTGFAPPPVSFPPFDAS